MTAARAAKTGGFDGVEGTGGTGGSGGGGDTSPPPFRAAVTALGETRPRPEVRLSPLPPPRRLAPFTFALEATVSEPEDAAVELADGRFVLLHDPQGQEGWRGTFRVVTLARAELEPEIAGDPLLPEVTWSWLTGALEARGAGYTEPSGTVTRSSSAFFGGLAERAAEEVLEIRASWTPDGTTPDAAAHLTAWCELLCQCAGLPPETGEGSSVVQLPQRRGPR
ncbi:DUF3000 domain-containing protein [Streptomyces albus]|uniref:DUF3000 domain-containing protein n=2 Tax=Streptomyces albus TaxID=1888 RepID=A0A6C1C6V5_9ACTN|nr:MULTISPECIES: DUF3000 domain-containing protein [Streptomyces]MDI6408537.1 DUF3000 domain-containing protein [Streptomyces albus]QID38748.1 DUF3000 domain-containing protein [Streptomyces albus]TGG80511.1 DUF3000 domain-containing protein [Streptomyces albus]UVN54244.1 DUF3000 domain-containing protein [Streptomyces albus]